MAAIAWGVAEPCQSCKHVHPLVGVQCSKKLTNEEITVLIGVESGSKGTCKVCMKKIDLTKDETREKLHAHLALHNPFVNVYMNLGMYSDFKPLKLIKFTYKEIE